VAYSDFLNRDPGNPYTGRVLLQIGGLYALGGDYPQAANYYRQAVQKYSGTEIGDLAQQELDFVLRYLYDSMEVAENGKVPQQERWCGPLALAKYLALHGTHRGTAELARLAQTDGQGTTMLGLVEAAGQLGVKLVGINASKPSEVPCPFIAYVNGDHFVLVREVRNDTVAVSDMGRAETLVKTDDFCKSWDGKALVAADKLPAAPGPDDEGLFLDPNALKLAKGGSPVMTGGAVTPPPCSPPGGGGGGSSVGSGSDPCDSSDTHSNSMLPGTSGSPTARTGVAAPGVHHVIDVLQTALHLSETDVSVGIRGPMTLSFDRTFMNEKGIPRTEFTDATNTTGTTAAPTALPARRPMS
jgi:hypothetical protein